MQQTIDEVSAIPTLLDRAVAAQNLVRQISAEAEEKRALRDMAICIAYLDQGVAQVTLYRDVLQISRGLFTRITQRAPRDSERKAVVKAHPDLFTDAVATARTAIERIRELDAYGEQAREIRDTAALMVLNGHTDENGTWVPPVTNADFARAADMNTARVAQIRTGVR